MRSLIHSAFLYMVTILLLAACEEKAAEPAPLATLARPTLILSAKHDRVLVPQSALVERGGIPGVYVLTEIAQARFRMVRTGKSVNGRVEILSGLSGSETLVAGDLRDVHDGTPIRPPGMMDVPGAKPSVNEASFAGQTQEQFSGQNK